MNKLPSTLANRFPVAPTLKPDTSVVTSEYLGVARLSSKAIFSGVNEVEIEHNGALYRLRQTSLGKLILTK